jgi:hypothetical protein
VADFVLNPPGSSQNPWTPANVIIPVGSLQATTGSWNPTGFVWTTYAHNATYGSTITSTFTYANPNTADLTLLGGVVRSGANAGAFVGLRLNSSTDAALVTSTPSGSYTSISTSTVITAPVSGTVFSVTLVNNGTNISISVLQDGGTLTFNASTTTTYVSETTMAAGAGFDPENNNLTTISQFTGTGVNAGLTITPPVGSDTLTGNTPTVTKRTNTVLAPFVARHGGRVLEPDRRIHLPDRRIFLPTWRRAA